MAYRNPFRAHPLRIATLCALVLTAFVVRADELKLRDGMTLKGTIVGFDDNAFKVETSFGYAVVRKDQVVTIFVTGSGNPPAPPPGAAPATPAADKPPAAISGAPPSATPASTPAKTPDKSVTPGAVPSPTAKLGPPPPLPISSVVASSTPIVVEPTAPAPVAAAAPSPAVLVASAPSTATSAPTPVSTAAAPKATAPAAKLSAARAPRPPAESPKAPEAILENVSGNTYTNATYRFQLYKPPDWQVMAAARTVLPGSIAALGTDDQETYLLIGQEPAGKALYLAAEAADKRLRDVMENFRPQGQEQMLVAGSWATAHRFRGSVDEHEWSGVVVLVPHGQRLYTIFGMTRADTDLVQIQENVIDRAIASLAFTD